MNELITERCPLGEVCESRADELARWRSGGVRRGGSVNDCRSKTRG